MLNAVLLRRLRAGASDARLVYAKRQQISGIMFFTVSLEPFEFISLLKALGVPLEVPLPIPSPHPFGLVLLFFSLIPYLAPFGLMPSV